MDFKSSVVTQVRLETRIFEGADADLMREIRDKASARRQKPIASALPPSLASCPISPKELLRALLQDPGIRQALKQAQESLLKNYLHKKLDSANRKLEVIDEEIQKAKESGDDTRLGRLVRVRDHYDSNHENITQILRDIDRR